MKRFILSLTAAAVLSMPMAASALEKMDNNQLKSSTGQAGVSIAVDDVVIYQKSIADTTYWDTDGLAVMGAQSASSSLPYASVGAAGIKIDHHDDMQKLTTIDAILDADKYGTDELAAIFGRFQNDATKWDDANNNGTVDDDEILDENGDVVSDGLKSDIGIIEDMSGMQDYTTSGFNATTGSTGNFTNGISPLTIDVGTCEALTKGWAYNTNDTQSWTTPNSETISGAVAGVVIGLPTVEITTYNTKVSKTVSLELRDIDHNGDGTIDPTAGDVASGAMNADHNTFLEIEKTGTSTMAILGGRLEIAPH